MTRSIVPALVLVGWFMPATAQTTLVLQPDAASGKDAVLHGLISQVNTNYGSISQWAAMAWTFNCVPGTVRGVMEFDLSSIPVGATVLNAELSLYAWDASNGFGQHSSLSGSNEAWIRRVTTPWNESTVTWNTAPSATTVNQVSVPGTTNPLQNYVAMDVTALVQNMVDDPVSSHGFLLREKTESYYRRLNFCTSDHSNTQLHPKLSVTYTVLSTNLPEPAPVADLQLYPNPAQSEVVVLHDHATSGPVTLHVVDPQGRIVRKMTSTSVRATFDVQDLPAGTYQVQMIDGAALCSRRLVIIR